MALPSSGQLSFSVIQAEHEGSNPISLTEYYSLFNGAPSSGEISVSDYYGSAWRRVFTAGTNGVGAPYTEWGYLSGSYGTFSDTSWGPGGVTISSIRYGYNAQRWRLVLSAASTAWTSITINGNGSRTLTRASATGTPPTYDWVETSSVMNSTGTRYLEIR